MVANHYSVIMKNFFLFTQDKIERRWFKYPCVDANGRFLTGKKVCVFGNSGLIDLDFLNDLGAEVLINPDNKSTSFSNIGIVLLPTVTQSGENLYFEILDYYIQTLKLLVHKQKSIEGFKHIVVCLPKDVEQWSTEYDKLAYYAIYGLVKGLGAQYAKNGLFINGIKISDFDDITKRYIQLLVSDNSCNIVGQVF